MANLASSKKRNKQNERNRLRNRARKAVVKTETRRFFDAIRGDDLKQAQELLPAITKKIDQITAKGTLHANTASRRKSRLAKRLNAAMAAKSA